MKKTTRVIGDQVITFYILRKHYSLFGGFMEFTNKVIVSDYDPRKVDLEHKYEIDMGVRAAIYTMLSTEHKLMTNYLEELKNEKES